MDKVNDGGPAFPRAAGPADEYMVGGHKMSHPKWEAAPGMSLRDWLAGQALMAIVGMHRLNSCGDFVAGDGLLQHHNAPRYAAETAYQFADAMLKARGPK